MSLAMSEKGPSLQDIRVARQRLAGVIYLSPCAYSETVSQLAGARTSFKLENLQMTGSFKERGAANRLLTLSEAERVRGVVAASAGNHGLAVAFHARRLGIRATIVMPEWAPLIKVTSARRDGAEVILAGDDYDEAAQKAQELCRERQATFVHPFDDYEVIAGQGTIGFELLEQEPALEAVIMPVGGGGLIGGVALAIKETTPRVRVIGVQAKNLAAMHASLAAGRIESLRPAPTIADGIAVRKVGALTFPLAQRYVDELVMVSEEEIANAILLLLEIEKTVVEGAGATTLAALLNRDLKVRGKRVALVLSGGNIDVNVISRIIEKGLVKDGRRVRLAVLLQDRPGALARLTALVAAERANILEILHHRAFALAEIGETEVELTLETTGQDQIRRMVETLSQAGYRVREL